VCFVKVLEYFFVELLWGSTATTKPTRTTQPAK